MDGYNCSDPTSSSVLNQSDQMSPTNNNSHKPEVHSELTNMGEVTRAKEGFKLEDTSTTPGGSMPEKFELRRSEAQEGEDGVWTKVDLGRGERLGPFEGVMRSSVEGSGKCAWEVSFWFTLKEFCKKGDCIHLFGFNVTFRNIL